MTGITLPHEWQAYPWQVEVLDALASGVRRICIDAHRRAGKDAVALNAAACMAHQEVGQIVHLFPQANRARSAIWHGLDDDGRRFIDQAFPEEIRQVTREQMMQIEFKNGSQWRMDGADNPSTLVGSNVRGLILSEYSQFPDATLWNYARPILAKNGGWMMAISTHRGRASPFYEMCEIAKNNKDWFYKKLTVDDTYDWDFAPLVTPEAIEAERRAGYSEAFIRQEFYGDPMAVGYSGAYYAAMLNRAYSEGRDGDFPYNADLPVYAAFDIGYSDLTVVIFFQVPRGSDRMHVIGSKAWQFHTASDIAQDIRRTFPWEVPFVILPWDARKPGPAGDTWPSVFEQFRLGRDEICVLDKGQGTLFNEISFCQQNFSTICFDTGVRPWTESKASNAVLLDALAGYRTDEMPKNPGVYAKTPKHSWESHYADAFRGAVVYRYGDYMNDGNWGPAPDYSAHDRTMGWR